MTRRTILTLLASFALLLGCNRHQAEGTCLAACSDDDEAFFEGCVANGTDETEGACRAGNRRCCALAAGCVGEIGDQIVDAPEGCPPIVSGECLPDCDDADRAFFESCLLEGHEDCGVGEASCCAEATECAGTLGLVTVEAECDAFTVEGCRPGCELFPDAAGFFATCIAEGLDDPSSGSLLCDAGDAECCADLLGCIGDVGATSIEPDVADPSVCCGADLECAASAYCDPESSECVAADCGATCVSPRSCEADRCVCFLDSGEAVVRCPAGQFCGVEGYCESVAPCGGVACPAGEACDGVECRTDCLADPSVCGPGEICDFGFCYPDGSCETDADCAGIDGYCGPGDLCFGCDRVSPDDCDGFNSDCDLEVDEDCSTMSCGDFVAETPEVCDGFDTAGRTCMDLGFNSGYLYCLPDCSDFAEGDCSDEICDNANDDDGDSLVDCEDPDCDSFAGACCEASGEPEHCDGFDEDCDYLIDEGCFPPEDCTLAGDEDGDGLADCMDDDCFEEPTCCVPGPELCNGFDDDCDTFVDEDVATDDAVIGSSCGGTVGECTPGTYFCDAGVYACTGTEPTLELCNGFDDDCNGTIDDPVPADDDCQTPVFCDEPYFCAEGTCLPTGAVDPCDDSEDCTDSTCTEATASCSPVTFAGSGMSCNFDTGFCDGAGTCISG